MTDPSPLSVGLGFLVFPFLALAVHVAIVTVRHKNARPADAAQTPAGRCHETCTVPFCDDPVTIRLHVGHDYWPFCVTHGLPYLTEGLRPKEGAA